MRIDVDRVYLNAPPCGGKGTQSQKLERFGFNRLVMSDLLRAHNALDGSSNLASDEQAIKVFDEAAAKAQDEAYVIDGFPRTVVQVEHAVQLAKDGGHRIKFVILKVSDQTCRKRLSIRREQHRLAGMDFRTDDDPKIYDERLEKYRASEFQILQRIQVLSPLSLFLVDGEFDPSAVHHLIIRGISA